MVGLVASSVLGTVFAKLANQKPIFWDLIPIMVSITSERFRNSVNNRICESHLSEFPTTVSSGVAAAAWHLDDRVGPPIDRGAEPACQSLRTHGPSRAQVRQHHLHFSHAEIPAHLDHPPPDAPPSCRFTALPPDWMHDTMASEEEHRKKRRKTAASVAGATEAEKFDVECANRGDDSDSQESWHFITKRDISSSSSSSAISSTNAPYARWCHATNGGAHSWDDTKLKCFLSETERKDEELVRTLVRGTALTSRLHPLIFETSNEKDSDLIHLRSLPYLEQLQQGQDRRAEYRNLSTAQKRIVGVGVRDIFLAGNALEDSKSMLDRLAPVLDDGAGSTIVQSMTISFYPTSRFRVLKFIEDLDNILENEWAPFFAQVMVTPKLFAVFVDPVELSFHNFENIIPLDKWLETRLNDGSKPSKLDLTLPSIAALGERGIFTCKLGGDSTGVLQQLSALDLYVKPLNKETRGGERFIFHSALLSSALTEALQQSEFLSLLPGGQGSNFRFVNYVFRCNRFSPDSAPFAIHTDTPYSDATRSHISRYTLLIYLTSGRGSPVLRIGDVDLTEVEEATCVIFEQRYSHEGHAFLDGDKVFLRTELVFEEPDLTHNETPASLFSEACYMTAQSVLDDSLASYAHECFERASSLHWNLQKETSSIPLYLHKHFQGIHFAANGYDYFFPKDPAAGSATIDARDCGIIAVLDYLNVNLNGRPFQALCGTVASLRERFGSSSEVFARLLAFNRKNSTTTKQPPIQAVRRLKDSDLDGLFKIAPDIPFVPPRGDRGKRYSDEDTPPPGSPEPDSQGSYEPRACCCPMHCYAEFDAWEDELVGSEYDACCRWTREQIMRVPLIVLGKELVLNESSLQIVDDKILILSDKGLGRINFAACWNTETVGDFITVDKEIPAPRLLLPPILFHEFEDGFHLILDVFRNDWMVEVDEENTIPVPVIHNIMEDEWNEQPVTFRERVFPGDGEDTSGCPIEFGKLLR